MPRIVLSYRRADSAAISGRIFDRLVQRYGASSIFMDIDEIPLGIDFRKHIAKVLSDCDAVIAVIGPHWTGTEAAPGRIREPTDPVRVEVQAALERGVPLIPVLVGDATMPGPADLPAELEPLIYRNACEIASGRDFHAHVDRLIRALDRATGGASDSVTAPASPPTPPRPAAEPATTPPVAVVAPPAPAPQPAPPAPSPARVAGLAALMALPQLVQFSQKTPLFVLALVVSVIGVASLADREDLPLARRIGFVAAVMAVTAVFQSALGVLRASMLEW